MPGPVGKGIYLAATVFLGLSQTAAGAELPPLEPFQLMRSLQNVQDRIAGGDKAALTMQGKLIVMTDEGFRQASAEKIADPRNIRALIAYGLSGGNPRTVQSLAPVIGEDQPLYPLAAGVVSYVSGRQDEARATFAAVDPLTLDPEVAAYIALAKGNANVNHDDQLAIESLIKARLLGPGTLVEESALRRLMALYMKTTNRAGFNDASADYARRFISSPYANQFAEMLVNGILSMKGPRTQTDIKRIASTMPPAFRDAIYLRLARQAAVAGHLQLSEFAASMINGQLAKDNIAAGQDQSSGERQPGERTGLQSNLYSRISALLDDGEIERLKELDDIDATKLPEKDRGILAAARAVTKAVFAPIEGLDLAQDDMEMSEDTEGSKKAGQPQSQEIVDADELLAKTRARLNAIDSLIEGNAK